MLPNAVKNVENKNVRDIDITSAKAKKKKLAQAIAESSPVNDGPKQRKLTVVQEPTVHELDIFPHFEPHRNQTGNIITCFTVCKDIQIKSFRRPISNCAFRTL